MIKDFKDKIAVITGAACGIGRSLAQSFAQRGMKLALVDINKETLSRTAEELRENGTVVMELVVDVSDRKQVAQMADNIYDHFGKVHILCNNAGVSVGGPAHLLPLSDWDWLLSINLFGILYCVKAFLPRMLECGEPCHIVNTSSLAGLLADGGAGPYTTSKFATVGLTEALTQQYFNSNVKFSVLCPAMVKTDLHINSQILGKDKSAVFNPDGEKPQEFKAFIEGFGSAIESGIDPNIVSEKVIEAISNDIFYIITHPEYLPLIEARANGIRDDILALNREPVKNLDEIFKNNEIEAFKYDNPGFSVKYPKNWTPIPLPPNIPIKFMALTPENTLSVIVADIIPNMELKDVINLNTAFLSTVGNNVKIISNIETKLKDNRTTAFEGLIEYKRNGLFSSKHLP